MIVTIETAAAEISGILDHAWCKELSFIRNPHGIRVGWIDEYTCWIDHGTTTNNELGATAAATATTTTNNNNGDDFMSWPGRWMGGKLLRKSIHLYRRFFGL
jgi:hypothetical protein